MSIFVGNQTAFFTGDPEEPFKYALEHGFTAFEWFSDKKHYDDGSSSGWDYLDVSTQRAAELKALTCSLGIRYSVHASCLGTPLTHPGMKDIFAAITIADNIGAALVNVHLDVSSGVTEFVKALEPAIIATHVRGLGLAIENTPLHSPEHFNQFFAELGQLEVESSSHVGMCIDIGHANCCEATRNDYIGFINQLSPEVNIIHAHVHENWGDSDSHLPLFTAASKDNDAGVRLFIDILKERGYAGSLIMEQWPEEHELLDTIFERLKAMLGDTAARLQCPIEVTSEVVDYSTEIEQSAAVETEEPEYRTISRSGVVEADSWALKEIIKFSATRKSWRRRLEAVKDLFINHEELSNSDLAAVMVYLRFLSTAEIPCVEDGGHFRPCHHAQAALDIEEAISKFRNESNAWILRRIYPYLPSHAEEFMRHEPLTRIRDIAHRNDIPKELKLDIKHNLQNKLHRSAGPEDLKTAERILGVITVAGADYSPDFVREFKVFYEELKEFFNAEGLQRRLLKLKEKDTELVGVIDDFVALSNAADPIARATEAWKVRSRFKEFAASSKLDYLAEIRLADIELEDFAFATISEAINELPKDGKLTREYFAIILIALQHIVLSEFMVEESRAILTDFSAWEKDVLADSGRLELLRLWASVQRGLRLCSTYADIVNLEFTGAVVALGKAFRIPQHAVEVYCEGDIRANIIFQFSRILGRAQRLLRAELEFAPWSVVNGGLAKGKMIEASSLEEFEDIEGEYLVLLRQAQGDEEIPDSVKGILLFHPIAHLSHLGVRARSGGVPFAAAEEVSAFSAYKELIGSEVVLEFTQDGISRIEEGVEVEAPHKTEIVIPEVNLCPEIKILYPDEIISSCCGAKAGASAELYNLSTKFTGFVAPKVMAVPYGVMELCLEADEELKNEYDELLMELDNAPLSELDDVLDDLKDLIQELDVPDTLLIDVAEYFGGDTILAVRSSSSGEDLKGFAGAGLYDSVIGVSIDNLAEALKEVWASKWTRRAVLSRNKYGVAHEKVFMGVLIQEVVEAEFSFVLHTANPVTGMRGEAGIELAVGFGETLASANQAGTPCSLKYSQATSKAEVLRCADISRALALDTAAGGLVARTITYSTFEPFLGDKLIAIASSLSSIGFELEDFFGTPQDIEGAYAHGNYYIVQSRPQAGIAKE